MNKTQQLLKEREEEIRGLLVEADSMLSLLHHRGYIDYWKQSAPSKEDVMSLVGKLRSESEKSFHDTTISLLLNSIKEEVEGMKIDGKFAPHTDERYHQDSYNSALSDISTLISETISNLTNKTWKRLK